VGSDTVTLHFSDSCQLMPYVASSSGLIVDPPGGSWACATVLTSLTLAPGEVRSEEVHVGSAAQGPYRYVQLGAGEIRLREGAEQRASCNQRPCGSPCSESVGKSWPEGRKLGRCCQSGAAPQV
jgi:hypothetical protein